MTTAKPKPVLNKKQKIKNQSRLNKLCYDVEKTDGLFGKNTIKGTKKFQKKSGGNQSGRLSDEELKKLLIEKYRADIKLR